MTMRWKRIGAADLVAVDQVDVGRRGVATAARPPPGRTARRRRCRRRTPWSPPRSRCAAPRRSRGSSGGGRSRTCGYMRASSSRICGVPSLLPSLTTMTSWSGVSARGGLQRRHHHARDGAAVVVGREEDAQAGRRSGRSSGIPEQENLSTDLSRGARRHDGCRGTRRQGTNDATRGSRRATSSIAPPALDEDDRHLADPAAATPIASYSISTRNA